MIFKKFLAFVLILALLISAVCLAEEYGEVDLYSPELYEGEQTVEATQTVTVGNEEVADQPMGAIVPKSEVLSDYAVAAPELVPMEAPQVVTLTEKKASVQMNVGETLQVFVNEGEVGSFTSKKPSLATVDSSGVVIALAKGKARIVFKPDGGKDRTLNITIIDPYEPKGISFAQGKMVGINVGDCIQLGAVLSPETARTTLMWTSSKTDIALVDSNGVVTAIKEGKSKISVKTANKKKATITVVVTDPYKPSAVSIVQGSSIKLKAGQSIQLLAGLIPENAISPLTWSGGKANVAIVDENGLVNAVGKGKATITVKTANGKKAKIKITVEAEEKPAVSSLGSGSYIGNANTGKFHRSSCGSVARMNNSNKVYFDSRDEAIRQGYDPCHNCKP